jgi:general secretion pathway protein K
MKRNARNSQRGVALVTAVLIVAVCATAAASILSRLELDIRRTANVVNSDQALRYGVAAEDFIAALLKLEAENTEFDHPGEEWEKPITLPIEDGFLQGQLFDQSGCFNVNNLDGQNATEHRAQLSRLLDALGLDRGIEQAMTDWIDPDSNPIAPSGAEDGQYLTRNPPYRAANTTMDSVSELRLVFGITNEIYDIIRPHVCATPKSQPININTASVEVLMSLAENFNKVTAEAIHAQIREFESPFESENEFRADARLSGYQIKVPIGVNTHYFLAEATATIGNTRAKQYSLMARDNKGNTTILSRSRGTF